MITANINITNYLPQYYMLNSLAHIDLKNGESKWTFTISTKYNSTFVFFCFFVF